MPNNEDTPGSEGGQWQAVPSSHHIEWAYWIERADDASQALPPHMRTIAAVATGLDEEAHMRLILVAPRLLKALDEMFTSVDELLVQTGEMADIQHILDAVGQAMQHAEAAIAAARPPVAEGSQA